MIYRQVPGLIESNQRKRQTDDGIDRNAAQIERRRFQFRQQPRTRVESLVQQPVDGQKPAQLPTHKLVNVPALSKRRRQDDLTDVLPGRALLVDLVHQLFEGDGGPSASLLAQVDHECGCGSLMSIVQTELDRGDALWPTVERGLGMACFAFQSFTSCLGVLWQCLPLESLEGNRNS